MKNIDEKDYALLKYSIIGPLITTPEAYSSDHDFFRLAAEKSYVSPSGETIKVSASTIQRWYYTYKKEGFEGLIIKRRIDYGVPRKISIEVLFL